MFIASVHGNQGRSGQERCPIVQKEAVRHTHAVLHNELSQAVAWKYLNHEPAGQTSRGVAEDVRRKFA
jgi:hypothetical protein